MRILQKVIMPTMIGIVVFDVAFIIYCIIKYWNV